MFVTRSPPEVQPAQVAAVLSQRTARTSVFQPLPASSHAKITPPSASGTGVGWFCVYAEVTTALPSEAHAAKAGLASTAPHHSTTRSRVARGGRQDMGTRRSAAAG